MLNPSNEPSEYKDAITIFEQHSLSFGSSYRSSCGWIDQARIAYQYTDASLLANQKIGILLVYDDLMWDSKLTLLSIENKQRYASLYGYELLVIKRPSNIDRPGGWFKLYALEQNLEKFDWLVYFDLDVVIMNYKIQLEWIIAMAMKHNKDLIISEDHRGLNSGSMIFRNSHWSLWFLQELWKQDHLIVRSFGKKKYPFEYEQRAFHFLLQTEFWKSRGLPPYEGDSNELWTHLEIVDQCLLNAKMETSLVPYFSTSQYVKGDFVAHLAGKKGIIREKLFTYLINKSNMQYALLSN